MTTIVIEKLLTDGTYKRVFKVRYSDLKQIANGRRFRVFSNGEYRIRTMGHYWADE